MKSSAKKKNTFVSVEASGEKKSRPGGRKKIFFAIFKRLLPCFNPSLNFKSNCFLLIIFTTEVDLFYYTIP